MQPLQSLADLNPAEAPPKSTDIVLEKWMALLDHFRKQHPINYKDAAETVGCQHSTAKKAFEDGNHKLNRPAIRDILLLEARAARTEAERKFEKLSGTREERLHANRNAVDVRAQEGQLVHGVAITAGALQNTTAILLQGMRPLAERALAEMKSIATADKADLKRILAIFRDVRDLAKGTTEIVSQKMQLERLLLGDPSAMAAMTAEITPADAVAEIRASERLLERIAREDPDGELIKELNEAGVPLRLIRGGK
jgi:hypothetical protein